MAIPIEHLAAAMTEAPTCNIRSNACISLESQECKADSSSDSDSNRKRTPLVEQTIRIMEEYGGTTLHPLHWHSFQQIGSFALSFQTHSCVACNVRISMLGLNHTNTSLVKCVACGIVCHRSCALDEPSRHLWSSNSTHCKTNRDEYPRRRRQNRNVVAMPAEAGSIDENTVTGNTEHGDQVKKGNLFRMVDSFWNLLEKRETASATATGTPQLNNATMDDTTGRRPVMPAVSIQRATASVSPILSRLIRRNHHTPTDGAFHDAVAGETGDDDSCNDESMPNDGTSSSSAPLLALTMTMQSFPAIAQAIQENVLASFQKRRLLLSQYQTAAVASSSPPPPVPRRKLVSPYPAARGDQVLTTGRKGSESGGGVGESNDAFLHAENVKRSNPITQIADRTLEVVKAKVSVSAVAGGIVGGLAGMAIAGPVGAYAGYFVAAAAGSSLMVAEATALSVVVAGIATGSMTGQQIQEHIVEKRRIITMGEEGTSLKVLLVRPNIKIDPVWDQICRDAKQSTPGSQLLMKKAPRSDSDIVHTAEDEIQTTDKVLLLVSRILNDKASRPGHVYRCLVESFLKRCRARLALCETSRSVVSTSPRARRDDAHAVIKHVTATLMEERPEFGISPGLTELTAAAVEGLVFGQLYDLVFEEIVEETTELDLNLWRKIAIFEKEQRRDDADPDLNKNLVSEQALDTLKTLPQAHSAADKLHFCVRFLDCIAEHFLSNTSNNVCADTLLKMVCQHLILLENQGNLNAQMVFLEEFVRDEQILCGRDGYALATLQASLNFLNMSVDFEHDIFHDDDGEVAPVVLPVDAV